MDLTIEYWILETARRQTAELAGGRAVFKLHDCAIVIMIYSAGRALFDAKLIGWVQDSLASSAASARLWMMDTSNTNLMGEVSKTLSRPWSYVPLPSAILFDLGHFFRRSESYVDMDCARTSTSADREIRYPYRCFRQPTCEFPLTASIAPVSKHVDRSSRRKMGLVKHNTAYQGGASVPGSASQMTVS